MNEIKQGVLLSTIESSTFDKVEPMIDPEGTIEELKVIGTAPSSTEEKLEEIKQLYEERLRSLFSHLAVIQQEITEDEMLSAMEGNSISKKFIKDRIKEVVDEQMNNHREKYISQLLEKFAQTRLFIGGKRYAEDIPTTQRETAKIAHLRKELEESHTQLFRVVNDADRDVLTFQQQNELLQQELERMSISFSKEQQESQSKYEEMIAQLKQSQKEKEVLSREFSDIALQNRLLNEEMKKIKNESLSIRSSANGNAFEVAKLEADFKQTKEKLAKVERERTELLGKFTSYGEKITQTTQEALSSMIAQKNSKNARLKKKIIEQKAIILKLQKEINQTKESYEEIIKELRIEIAKLREDWDSQEKLLQDQYNEQLYEMQNAHSAQISGIQEECQQILQNKFSHKKLTTISSLIILVILYIIVQYFFKRRFY